MLGALAGLVLLGIPAVATAQFAVSPVIVQLPASEGVSDALIRVDNEGDRPMQFLVYVLDFDQDPEGNHVFADARTSPSSCANRLHVAPGAMSVSAGERGLIQVRLQPAPHASTCWSMVFIETPSTSAGGLLINQRIGVKLYGLSAGGNPEGELLEAAAAVARDSIAVSFQFRNPGDWPVRPEGAVEIRDFNGVTVAAVPVPAFSVLPHSERHVEVVIPAGDLAVGRYVAIPILDFGADFLAGAQVDFRLTD